MAILYLITKLSKNTQNSRYKANCHRCQGTVLADKKDHLSPLIKIILTNHRKTTHNQLNNQNIQNPKAQHPHKK